MIVRTLLLVAVFVLLIAWLLSGPQIDTGDAGGITLAPRATATVVGRDGHVRELGYGQIRFNGRGPEAWRWQLVTTRRRLERRLAAVQAENRRLRLAMRATLALPTGHWLDGAFLCLHRYERDARQGWQTNTGNGYRGGLQMDRSFARTYAPAWVIDAFGPHPDRWPAAVQITAGIHAWTTRGFTPWPTTRRTCGL